MGSSEEIYWDMAKIIESWTRKCHHALIFCHNLFIMNCLLVVVSVLARALPSLTLMLEINYSDFRMIQSTLLLAFGNAQLAGKCVWNNLYC